MISFFHIHDHVHSRGMSSTFKLRVQPFINDTFRCFNTDHTCSECNYIRIVVFFRHSCCIWIAAYYCTDTIYFIRCKRDPCTGSADCNSQLYFTACHRITNLFTILRIIAAFISICSIIHNFISQAFQIFYNLIFHVYCRMIVCNPYLHILVPTFVFHILLIYIIISSEININVFRNVLSKELFMVKLIASDLDGTLLQNGARDVNPIVFDQIRTLKEHGIMFAAASGRQYLNLRRLFTPVQDDIAYIAENGSLCIYNEETISKGIIEQDLAYRILDEVARYPQYNCIISGERVCYSTSKNPEFYNHMVNVIQNHMKFIDDPRS